MTCLSFNVCGVRGASKLVALKLLFKSCNPDVIFLQETMCEGSKVIKTLSIWLKDWSFFYLDLDGHSGGLVTTWSPKLKILSSLILNYEIMVELEAHHLGSSF